VDSWNATSLSEQNVSNEWDVILRWLDEDAVEALKAVGVIVKQGLATPENIVSKMIYLLEDSSLRALTMQILSETLPLSRASVSTHIDTILNAVSCSFMSEGGFEEREACRMTMKLAEAFPDLSRHAKRESITEQLLHAQRKDTWDCTRLFAQESLVRLQPQAVSH
jgi:hypothetical protein